MRLTADARVPGRPLAVVYLSWDRSGSVDMVVEEGTSTSVAVRFDGVSFRYEAGRGKWSGRPSAWGFMTDEEAACFSTLSRSGTFCMSQARSDMPRSMAGTSFWHDILKEMRTVYPVAIVTLS